MMIFSKKLNSLFAFAVLSIFMFSCQSDPVESIKQEAGFQAEVIFDGDGDPCTIGDELDFTMELSSAAESAYVPSGNATLEAEATLVSGGVFTPSEECLCRVTKYQMNFTGLGDPATLPAGEFQLLDAANNPIPYTATVGAHATQITVNEDYLTENMYVVTDGSELNLDLYWAGGICMIENLSNPYPVGDWVTPLKMLEHDRNGEVVRVKYYLPTTGLPVNVLLPANGGN